MTNEQIFQTLKEQYGNHSKVAEALGISPRLYRRWRSNGKLTQFAQRVLGKMVLDPNRPADEME